MKRNLSLVVVLLALLLVVGAAVAQTTYTADSLMAALVAPERLSRTTLNIAISVNNIEGNILNIGQCRPEGNFDSRGFCIVEIEAGQSALPIVGSLPAGAFTSVTLRLEDTDFEWPVQVDANGMFYTEFPVESFPPGEYYMTLNGVRIFRIVIP